MLMHSDYGSVPCIPVVFWEERVNLWDTKDCSKSFEKSKKELGYIVPGIFHHAVVIIVAL